MVWKCKHAKKNHSFHRFGSLGIFFTSMNPVPYVFSLVFSCWHSWTLICFDRDHFKCSERDNNSGRIEELEASEKMLRKENMDLQKRPILEVLPKVEPRKKILLLSILLDVK